MAHFEQIEVELKECLQRGIENAKSVLANWSQGDLAAAVNGLEEWMEEAKMLVRK